MSTTELANLVSRLEAVTTKLESVAARGGGAAVSSEFLDAYDANVLGGNLKKFLELSTEFGGDVNEHAQLLKNVFNALRDFLTIVAQHKTPPPDVFTTLVKPLTQQVEIAIDYFEKHRASKSINHLQAIKEAVACAGWVNIAPKPAQFVKQTYDSTVFYTNKVLKEFKGKNEKQVEWSKVLPKVLMDLKDYVHDYHTTGLMWNPEGSAASGATTPAPSKPSSAPPSSQKETQQQLFSEIGKGGSVTSGLKKVTDDMKTHKNPELKASSVVKATNAKTTSAGPKPAASQVKKPPVFALQGKKWVVEWQDDNNDICIKGGNMSQTVYIFKCTKSTIKIEGKVNSIMMSDCKRCAVLFESAIGTYEIINCQSVQAQVTGSVPTISIDKTDGCQIYLSKDSLSTEIITAKSSEMNIMVPKGDGDYSEHAIPEQFKTTWDAAKKNLHTKLTDING